MLYTRGTRTESTRLTNHSQGETKMATERQIAFIAKLIQEGVEFLSIKENP